MLRKFFNGKKPYVFQKDLKDCGVACLSTIFNIHQVSFNYEELRDKVGISTNGSNLFGIKLAAEKFGFEVTGFEVEDLNELKTHSDYCILHINKDNLLHFVVLLGYKNQKFQLFDPAVGLIKLTNEELSLVWQSRKLISFKPTNISKKSSRNTILKYSWILNHLRSNSKSFFVLIVFGVLISFFGLTIAFFSQMLIDNILPKNDRVILFVSIISVFSFLFFKSILDFFRKVIISNFARNFNIQSLKYFYDKLLQLKKSFFDTRQKGEILSRINDTQVIQVSISSFFGGLVIDILIYISSLTLIFIYDFTSGVITALFLPIYMIFAISVFNKVRINQQSILQKSARVKSHYLDTFQGIHEIKMHKKHKHFSHRSDNLNVSLHDNIYDFSVFYSKYNLYYEMISILFLLVIISINSINVLNNAIEIGVLVALISLTGQISQIPVRFSQYLIQFQKALVAFDRIFEFTSMQTDNAESTNQKIDTFQCLEINNLGFSHKGSSELFFDLNFQAKKGQWILLYGDNGTGKSTLFDLIVGFKAFDKGTIKINDINLMEYDFDSLRDIIGYVPQKPVVFDGTLLFNICLSDNLEIINNCYQFCNEYRFDEYFKNFPQSYDSILGEGGIELSGGQKQLVSFARTLFSNPELLLLDEITSSMDKETEDFVYQIITKIVKHKCVIMITHNLNAYKYSDEIYLLDNRKLCRYENIEDFIKSPYISKTLLNYKIENLFESGTN